MRQNDDINQTVENSLWRDLTPAEKREIENGQNALLSALRITTLLVCGGTVFLALLLPKNVASKYLIPASLAVLALLVVVWFVWRTYRIISFHATAKKHDWRAINGIICSVD